ncbi:hypothetical protein KAR91_52350 [Candidatus Pacearchaeota archaeon]|nr:hypothetical protein [Candidatus Pacearchaeota archaeon]
MSKASNATMLRRLEEVLLDLDILVEGRNHYRWFASDADFRFVDKYWAENEEEE